MPLTNCDRMRKQVKFTIDDNGCFIPQGRVLNQDGYLRVKDSTEDRLVMMHRLAWEQEVGHIPEGYEIDHMCKNRACFNTEHLQCLPGEQHTVEGNRTRYRWRRTWAKYLLLEGLSPYEVGEIVNINWRSIFRYKAELGWECL